MSMRSEVKRDIMSSEKSRLVAEVRGELKPLPFLRHRSLTQLLLIRVHGLFLILHLLR